MPSFFMFGKYSTDSVLKISRKRSQEAIELAEEFGGEITSMYAALGAYDLVMVVSFPDMQDALKFSVSMSKAMGISFSTLPALPMKEFEELISSQ
ncbi:GYD domain-containing protein [Candidatus Saccharibacteria bacterium]|nr:GYD domain-containing protein [Calditrichia bacterium]NIW00006.1 GYD domain-containing protein [Candidatus Saccharibacteria bacterium]